MKRFEGILICTDLDGTLLGSDRRISAENKEAIEYFKREGGRFTFVTGRMPSCVGEIYEAVRPNAPVGCINGGGLYDFEGKRYLWTQELPRDVLELVRVAERAMPDVGFQVDTFENIWFCRENATMKRFREITGVPNLTARYDEIREPFAKVVFGDPRRENIDRVAAVLAEQPLSEQFTFVRSEKTLYEILPKGINKGSVLPRLAEHLGISMKKTVAVGDYDNDLEMLRAAGVGVAVANALPAVKAVADRITVSNDEHAIAQIIRDIESGELKL